MIDVIYCFVDIYALFCFVQAQTRLGWVDHCKSSTEPAATRAIGEQQHRGLSRTWPQSQMVWLLQGHMEALPLCAPLEICNDVQRQHGPQQKYLLYLYCSNQFLTSGRGSCGASAVTGWEAGRNTVPTPSQDTVGSLRTIKIKCVSHLWIPGDDLHSLGGACRLLSKNPQPCCYNLTVLTNSSWSKSQKITLD